MKNIHNPILKPIVTEQSVINTKSNLSSNSYSSKKWSKDDDKILHQMLNSGSNINDLIITFPERSKEAIRKRARDPHNFNSRKVDNIIVFDNGVNRRETKISKFTKIDLPLIDTITTESEATNEISKETIVSEKEVHCMEKDKLDSHIKNLLHQILDMTHDERIIISNFINSISKVA